MSRGERWRAIIKEDKEQGREMEGHHKGRQGAGGEMEVHHKGRQGTRGEMEVHHKGRQGAGERDGGPS